MSRVHPNLVNLSRRAFLAGSAGAGAGLVLGCLLPTRARAALPASASVGPWVRVAPDGGVSILVEKAEMGQGVHSALAMLIAEELEVAWEAVSVEPKPLAGSGHQDGTGASSSVRLAWRPLREAGAAAREMLVRAAADRLGVPPAACEAQNGTVHHRASGRSVGYGEVAERAAALPIPQRVALKAARDFRLIGTPAARVDIPAKVTGEAVFGIDVRVAGMLYAAPALCPYPGGRLVSANRDAARAMPGVREVVEIPDGLAVVADHYWQARAALAALDAKFSGDRSFDSDGYSAALQEALETPGVLAHEQGVGLSAGDTPAPDARDLEARYEVPFLAHATMEPQNCTASVRDGRCEIWAPTQAPSRVRKRVAQTLGLPPEAITVHTTSMGGGFGRRSEVDDAIQAALAANAVGKPVKVIWTREDDTRNDYYRPACAAHLSARLAPNGRPEAVRQHVAGPWHGSREIPAWLRRRIGSLQKKLEAPLVGPAWPDALEVKFPRLMREGVEGLVAGEVPAFQYDIANQRLEYSLVDCELRIGWWRSVSGSQTAFFVESFIDECAHAAGRDPVAYRRELADARDAAVLDRAAAMAGWGRPMPEGTGLGVALFRLFGTTVCEIVEVDARGGALPRVERVWCALDCGEVVNPDTVRAQMEGSIVFGLTAALDGRITLREGRVEQSNFHDYPLLQMRDMPQIQVEIVANPRDPGGIGEPGTPPIAPALTNAIFAATGRRIRKLPVREAFEQQQAAASADGRRSGKRVYR